ncbi:hypothetical protein KL86CLO1_13369 [uncultured Eubacteriales bacterium]|uniref:Uncharacterized protein n=1 Tax=uncultured Eubacteriales bacterium TaxID=172733 RepID=A0A212KJH3_9FIRM|nr:hypothetical protein KL86CLO1_13369 [uncultured Eubacteriales bacterium]
MDPSVSLKRRIPRSVEIRGETLDISALRVYYRFRNRQFHNEWYVGARFKARPTGKRVRIPRNAVAVLAKRSST